MLRIALLDYFVNFILDYRYHLTPMLHNPVKRGYIDEASHWRYFSARDYEGIDGLLEIERFW